MGTQISTKNTPCLILAAGEIRDHKALAGQLPPGIFVVCADGGLHHCGPLGLRPHLFVGDGDSVRMPLPASVERVALRREKDYTDTAHAVLEAHARGYREVYFAGMLGGYRVEHALANVQTAVWCARQGMRSTLLDGVATVHVLHGEDVRFTMPARERCYFSLLAHSDVCEGVTIEGGAYPLDGYDLHNWDARAVSNEFTARPVGIHMRRGTLLVVCTPMEE